ncbi:MAG: lysine--tRNA ligase [Methanomassiliicoccales archaeon]
MEEDDLQEEFNRLIEVRMEKLRQQIARGEVPYAYSYQRTATVAWVREHFADAGHEPSADSVRLAGRIMVVRDHGKSCFMDLKDMSGTLQLYGSINDLGDSYSRFLEVDAGDILGVEGAVFRTRKGELTLRVKDFTPLAKSLRPLPEKYHGLKDPEIRYRMRYLDLIVNDESMQTFVTRSKFISSMRRWLDSRGFLEVETPILTPIAGGALARPFKTYFNFLEQEFYLRIATELYLKRLIVGGMEKVYEIGKDFRNEDMDTTHNPEFTMMELYHAFADYTDMMDLTEHMLSNCIKETCGTLKFTYGDATIDFSGPWKRMSMLQAIHDVGEIDINDFKDKGELLTTASRLRLENITPEMDAGQLLSEIFDQRVQRLLVSPTIIYDHPASISPLAKKSRRDSFFAERFECFINGMEIANAFSELNNPLEQKENFEKQAARREAGDREAHPYDKDYVTALEYGLPPTGGLGVGIDRIVMLISGAQSIKDVMLFPQMRRKEE